MRQIFDTFSSPADHLALDEAILLSDRQALRVWEFAAPIVIAGRSTRVEDEIDRDFCQSAGIPIMRRCTGGAAVVGGPGCLMYSVVLSINPEPALRRIDVAHDYVMDKLLAALRRQLPEAQRQGICDLTWHNKKCSGNSLRITRHSLLYHGTLLYDFDLARISQCLKTAPRQPEYRCQRDHASFVTNVPVDPARLRTICVTRWRYPNGRTPLRGQGKFRRCVVSGMMIPPGTIGTDFC